MVKTIRCTAGGVASQAGQTVVAITVDAIVLVVGFRVGMAGSACKFGVIRGVGVAIGAGAPFAVVFPAVYREILCIMIKSRGRPGAFRMTGGTIV